MTVDIRTESLNWLMDIATERDAPGGLIWHYTDLGGLLGVLSTDTFWASATTLLNDTQEIEHGRKKMRDALARAEASMTPEVRDWVHEKLEMSERDLLGGTNFVLCASTDGDSLSQWRGYSGGSGYAIGIRTSGRMDLLQVPNADEPTDGTPYVSPWRRVLYDANKKRAMADRFIQRLVTMALPPPDEMWNDMVIQAFTPSAYGAAVSRMKHSGFKDEREVRRVATVSAAAGYYNFRAGPYGPTPYVKLTGVPAAASAAPVMFAQVQADKLPIAAIRIGPTPHTAAAEEGLRSALVRYGYDKVKIKRSRLPFR